MVVPNDVEGDFKVSKGRSKRSHVLTVLWSCLAVVVPAHTVAGAYPPTVAHSRSTTSENKPRVVDMELARDGTLSGTVVDVNGRRKAGVEVQIRQLGGKSVLVTTDKQGRFAASGKRGGVYQLVVHQSYQICRAWQAGTAPPSAQSEILLVDSGDIARAQRKFGSLFFSNHVLLGLILVGAIAIPVIIAAQDDSAS